MARTGNRRAKPEARALHLGASSARSHRFARSIYLELGPLRRDGSFRLDLEPQRFQAQAGCHNLERLALSQNRLLGRLVAPEG